MADAMPIANGTVFAETSGPTCSAKKKIHVVHYIWLVIEKLEGSKKTTFKHLCNCNVCSCVKYLQGFPLKKAT